MSSTTALVWVRKSQGSEDSISLEIQRDSGVRLAQELGADNIDQIDLGIHTGFSILSDQKTADDDYRLDANDTVQSTLNRLESGEIDYLVAYDQSRLCRDGWVSRIREAAAIGDCTIRHVDDESDRLTRDLRHRIEQEVKQTEIKKSKAAIERRQEQGKWQGGAPTGFSFTDGDIKPDEEFCEVLNLIRLKDEGESHRDAIEQISIDISPATVTNVLNRRSLYEKWNNSSVEILNK